MKTYAVFGLGYVGLGLATSLSQKSTVIGYDINQERIHELQNHEDRNKLLTQNELSHGDITYTHHLAATKQANFYIVAVSTPAYFYEIPDLSPLIAATEQLGTVLKKEDIVVFESTVYPGATEGICIPILEKISRLTCGKDFQVGYSPERINPGDTQHTLKSIPKIISAQNPQALKAIHETYKSICDTVYPVSNIPTAEAIKILENTQRDINIAIMNEFSKIMHALNLDLHEIIEGAKTKFGFVPYKPGFVGGHCISIDPHYLAFEAKRHGIYPELILTARKINDNMTHFVIDSMIKLLIKNKIALKDLSIGVFGIAYKENSVDTRNSLAIKLIKELVEYGFHCRVHDPLDHSQSADTFKFKLENFDDIDELTVAIIAVSHDYYRDIGLKKMLSKCKKPRIVMDIPNLFVQDAKQSEHLIYWNL